MISKPHRPATGMASSSWALSTGHVSTCATKLGDLLHEIVVVGGLVPYLLVDQENLPSGLEPHAGTMDLDMGLALAILRNERYQELPGVGAPLVGALRRAADYGTRDSTPEVNDQGNERLQTWTVGTPHPVTVDFLIPPTEETDEGVHFYTSNLI